jgi:hypothetical protein
MRNQLSWPAVLLLLPFLSSCDKPAPTESAAPASASQEPASVEELSGAAAEPFDIAEVFFEFNTTDDDLGFQLLLDAEGWNRVTVDNPRDQQIVRVVPEGPLAEIGITELRFESAEPRPEAVLRRFPAGEYTLRGQTVEGTPLLSRARLSHHFVPRPTISPRDGQLVDKENVVVRWTAPGAERVEIIIEHEDLGHTFDVIVSGSTNRLTVPPQFLRRGQEYKIEILSIAPNGNRTIVESTFRTSR